MNNQTNINSIEGTYQIKVHTPMGVEDGTLTLLVDGSSLSGKLENSKGITEFNEGTVEGSEVNFATKIKTPVGRMKAKVSGKIDKDNIAATAKLPLGTAQIEGKRVK